MQCRDEPALIGLFLVGVAQLGLGQLGLRRNQGIFEVHGIKREQDIAMQVLGARGLGWSGEGFDDSEIARTRKWLITRADSIWGGTSEIQRNIVAERILGLPRK